MIIAIVGVNPFWPQGSITNHENSNEDLLNSERVKEEEDAQTDTEKKTWFKNLGRSNRVCWFWFLILSNWNRVDKIYLEMDKLSY